MGAYDGGLGIGQGRGDPGQRGMAGAGQGDERGFVVVVVGGVTRGLLTVVIHGWDEVAHQVEDCEDCEEDSQADAEVYDDAQAVSVERHDGGWARRSAAERRAGAVACGRLQQPD